MQFSGPFSLRMVIAFPSKLIFIVALACIGSIGDYWLSYFLNFQYSLFAGIFYCPEEADRDCLVPTCLPGQHFELVWRVVFKKVPRDLYLPRSGREILYVQNS